MTAKDYRRAVRKAHYIRLKTGGGRGFLTVSRAQALRWEPDLERGTIAAQFETGEGGCWLWIF